MDSQETLVDLALLSQKAQAGLTVLCFSPDDMNNTKISVRGSNCLSYVVESNRDNTCTTVYRVEGQSGRVQVAQIHRGNLLPDKITFREIETMRLSQWLKSKALSDFPATMTIGNVEYIWKKNMFNQLSMVAKDEPATPLAWFDRTRKPDMSGQAEAHPSTLIIRDEADDARDSILVACIILEHKIRLRARVSGITVGAAPIWKGSLSANP